jgi:hypothetical protein
MGNSAITGIRTGTPAFKQSFTNASLSSGILTVTHNLNSQYTSVTVWNNSDLIIIPDDVTATDANTTTVDLTSYGTITGTWNIVIQDPGGNLSTSTATDLSIAGAATGDRLVYDGANWVRKERAAFQAVPSSLQGPLAVGSVVQIAFGTEIFDDGGNFASDTFTAPVTGRYQLSCLIRLNFIDTAANLYFIRIVTTARNYVNYWIPLMTADYHDTKEISILADMTAGDTAIVEFNQGTGTSQTQVSTDSWFSGFLIA